MVDFPFVSIIVPTYLESTRPYLDYCMRAINNIDYPRDRMEVIVTSPFRYRPEYPGAINVSPCQDCNFATNVNYGISQASESAEYFMLLTDDTIITKNAMKNMVMIGESFDQNNIVGALSNCDNYWLYLVSLGFKHKDTRMVLTERFYKLNDWAPYIDSMIDAESIYPRGVILPPKLCLYANLIPKKIWKSVGGFDETYNQGYEDTDLCLKAQKNGFSLCVAMDSIIWHFGGITSEKVVTEESKLKNEIYFAERWKKK